MLNTVHDCFSQRVVVTLRYITSGTSVYGIRGPFFFFAAKAHWLIRFSLNGIPKTGCDSSLSHSCRSHLLHIK